MPVRSSISSVLVWPRRDEALATARAWAARQLARRPDLLRIGCFGSAACGGWGVGSDLDLVAVVQASDQPFERRTRNFELESLPVPADLLVYTAAEWTALLARPDRFANTMRRDVIWLCARGDG